MQRLLLLLSARVQVRLPLLLHIALRIDLTGCVAIVHRSRGHCLSIRRRPCRLLEVSHCSPVRQPTITKIRSHGRLSRIVRLALYIANRPWRRCHIHHLRRGRSLYRSACMLNGRLRRMVPCWCRRIALICQGDLLISRLRSLHMPRLDLLTIYRLP
jgi:hypothetical protein